MSVSKNRGLFHKLPGLFQFNEILPKLIKEPSTPAGSLKLQPAVPHWFPVSPGMGAAVIIQTDERKKYPTSTERRFEMDSGEAIVAEAAAAL
ncbi:MAG TPA: hypothetical protein PLE48_04910 [Thiobacillus sp.]|nr:hypothetical protein [Thiobacillus sp.]HQT69743.1 hypothetical protein [Thiobacillus sp.]